MNRRFEATSATVFVIVLLSVASSANGSDGMTPNRPNILWITTEDMSPHLGCFGDPIARTPNLDRLAETGVRYTRAFATCSICAPARSALISGMYASTLGSQHMRSRVRRPNIKCLPENLREVGYYCSNNWKTDYNFSDKGIWNASSNKAHWRKRKDGQPFFSVFNFITTHEGKNSRGDAKTVLDEYSTIPPYFPQSPGVRREWATSYRNIERMDKQAAGILEQLKEDGLADDTIVFFFSDHGMGMPRGKFWMYESGLHVPLIVHFPEKYRHLSPVAAGATTDQIVSFVDFAPTVLSLCGVPVPEAMQGKAFLGAHKQEARSYVFAGRDRVGSSHDLIRSVRDKRYKYIRNFQPYIPQDYESIRFYNRWHPIYRDLEALRNEGKLNADQFRFVSRERRAPEELYDLEKDPYELNNLTGSKEQADALLRMRKVLRESMIAKRDLGLIPEYEMHKRAGKEAPYALGLERKQHDPAQLLDILDLVLQPDNYLDDAARMAELRRMLGNKDSLVRYWATVVLTDFATRNQKQNRYVPELTRMLGDESADVRLVACGALVQLGKPEQAIDTLSELLTHTDSLVRMRTVGVLMSYPPARSAPLINEIQRAARRNPLFGYAGLVMKWYVQELKR